MISVPSLIPVVPDALRIATARLGGTPEVTQTNAPIEEGAEDATKPISEAGGESPALSAQSTDNVSATTGVREAERDGVVSTRADVTESTEREGSKPVAVTDEEAYAKRTKDDTTAPAYSDTDARIKRIADRYEQAGDTGTAMLVRDIPNKRRPSLVETAELEIDQDQIFKERAEKASTETKIETKGADVGTETTETVKTTQEGQAASTAGEVSKGKRGRPKADITEEQRAEKDKARTEARADYMKGERALPKLQADLDKANAPIDETNIADDEGLKNAENDKRAAKRNAINAMLDLEAKHRGTALGNRVKAALADRSKISQKEYDDVVAGRKYKAQERINKSSASNDEVEAADEGFNKAKNAAQALTRVIKTGTGFQKFLAKRLRSLVAGVNFVVVEETDPLPEQLSRHQEAWGNDNSRARGVYFENTATGERTIFVRGASAGSFQGINNTTVLHEALHAALQQKLELALLAVQRGFSGDAKLVRAYNDLIAVMNNAKDEYNRLANLGELPAEMYYLKTVSGVFSNPHEFVSYGMTDPFFQKFLMGAYGFEEETGFFNRFVDALREMLGMATDTINALSDLIVVTDKLVSSKLTPTMKMIAKADKANAIREARVGKVYTQTPKMPEESTAVIQETQADIEERVQYHLEQIQRSRDAEEAAKNASLLFALRDPKKILPAINRLWKSMDRVQVKTVLAQMNIDVSASWGSSYVPELANTNVLMQKMAGLTNILLESAADISTDAMRVFSKNPGEMRKIENVALAATLAKIDPADKSAKVRSPKLDAMFNGLTEGGQRVYTEMRDHLNDMTDYYMLLLEESINKENIPEDGKALIMARIKQIYEASKRITPYFALTREGPYWLSVKKGLGGEREFWMRPSLAERDALAEQVVADGIPKNYITTGNNVADLRKETYQKSDLLKDVFTAIENVKDTDPKAKENLKDAVYELYLRTMPENSFRGQFSERQNVTGFSTDVLRGFNETAVKMAVQLSRLKYGPQLRLSISAARDSAKGRPEVEVFIDDMERRVVSELNPRERDGFDTFATIMNRLSAITYLSGPSTALIQPISILQTGVVILCHDDIYFDSKNWGQKILNHFKRKNDYGILGLAGTTHLPKSAKWWEDFSKMKGIVNHENEGKKWESRYANGIPNAIHQVCLVDGLFIAIHKNRIKHTFNESVPGFHFYDMTFCTENHLSGVQIGVIYNIRLTHKSIGMTNESWEKNREEYIERFKNELPISITPNINYNVIKPKQVKEKYNLIVQTSNNSENLVNFFERIKDLPVYDNLLISLISTDSNIEDVRKYESENVLIYEGFFETLNKNLSVLKWDDSFMNSKSDLLFFSTDAVTILNDVFSSMYGIFSYLHFLPFL